ncbi:serine/threonine protein kinase [Spongiactinospora gelatinilytica]|uniref:Serine/threonine protein kinase n=1 Tax=Spongiactinospora gelatinilytica TaxID=2666298 RepID=A0A2W2HGF8_9ACTN|nr:serine/threonine-protein kinase [Spongiactinospora gelatinilytica]PZG54099.1 serine/threonine protein kinase [Spongiactinospora gelatinilytica]
MNPQETQTPDMVGHYRLIKKIGEGGMGVVYLGIDDEGTDLAVKILHPHVAADLKARDRLTREVETMRRVRSPHVADVIDAELTGAQPFIVTRFAPGRTLEETVLVDGPLPAAEVIRLARGLCAALVAIHAADVIHRDLKPANVILVGGEPLVIDFGIAHLVNATRLTQTGMFVGTPGYLAPEIIKDTEITQAADVHALASTVFFGATGKPPFGTGTFESVCFNIMNGSAQVDEAPAWLRGWLRAALAVEPGSRPTARGLAQMARSLDPSVTSFHEAAPPREQTKVMGGRKDGTRVLSHEDGYADLLPPVEYTRPGRGRKDHSAAETSRMAAAAAPPAAPPPVQVPPYVPPAPYADQRVAGYPPPQPAGRPAAYAPPGEARPYEPPAPPRERRPPYRVSHPVLGALLLATLVGAAFIMPVLVSALAIVLVLCLRVGEHLFGDLAERRKVRGNSGADPVLALLGTPWALIKAGLGTAVHVPLSVMFGMCVWGVLAYGGGMSTNGAAAYAAGAFTAGLFVLPGGRKPRRAVSRVLTGVIRSPRAGMVTAVSLAVITAFVLLIAFSTAPSFAPWKPPEQVIENLTDEFRRRTDEASMGAVDLVTGLIGDLMSSLGLGFLSPWS